MNHSIYPMICDECGEECGLVKGCIVTASDEWGHHEHWGEVSDCCHADFHEMQEVCWKCGHHYSMDDLNCPECGATSAGADPDQAAIEMAEEAEGKGCVSLRKN